MPYIILGLPTLEYEAISTDGKVKDILWKQMITVRTVRESSSNVDTDRGRTDMLEITDNLNETFNSDSIKQTQSCNNIRKINLNKVDSTFDVVQGREVYESVYELTYYTRLTVSL